MKLKNLSMFNRKSFIENSKNLFILSIPVFIELLLTNLLGTIDTIMIGNFDPSGKLITATSNAGFIINFLIMLFTISSTGVGIVVSQYLGAGRKDSTRVLSQGVLFNLIISIFVTVIFIFSSRYILIAMKVPSEILEECNSYLFILSFSLPFQSLIRVLSANLKSFKKPFYVSIVYLISNLLNILLNYLLIFGKLGLPSLGCKGAAIATLSCHILVCLLCIYFTKRKLKLRIFTLSADKEILNAIVKIGLPSSLEMICYNVSQLIVLAQINKLTTPVITARSYVFMFQTYVYMFSSAIGTSNAVLVGYSVGEGKYQNAKDSTGLSSLYTFPITIIVIGLLNILGFLIFPLLNKDPEILNQIYAILPWVFLVEISRAGCIIYINALKSGGDPNFPVIVGVICMFLIAALGSYILGIVCKLGLVGIYIAIGLDEFTRGLLCYIRWKRGKWTNYKVSKY